MSERYSRLFTLEENCYVINSPVILSAGALLKDNQTGNVLAQLKFKSVCKDTIKAVTVFVQAIDVAGRNLGDPVKYQYLDLSVHCDEDFGSRVAIPLIEASSRSFYVSITEVIFGEKSIWNCPSNTKWLPLPKSILLSSVWDKELVKQYKMQFGSQHQYQFQSEKDLWQCSCGAINKKDEEECHNCGTKLCDIQELDIDALNKAKIFRLEEERRIEEKRLEDQRKQDELQALRAKKARKLTTIIVSIVVISIAIGGISYHFVKANREKAERIAQEEREEAERIAQKEQEEAELNRKYNSAIDLLEQGDDLGAYEILHSLGNYKDAADYVLVGDFILTSDKSTWNSNGEKTTTEYIYDSGKLIKTVSSDPMTGTTVFSYDSENHLKSSETDRLYYMVKSKGKITDSDRGIYTKTYNTNGDVVLEVGILEGGVQKKTEFIYEYDSNNKKVKESWVVDGKPISVWDSFQYEYNSENQVVKMIKTKHGGNNGDRNYITTYEYDSFGNLITLSDTYRITTYTYSFEGELTKS